MAVHEITRREWETFFPLFSRQYQQRLVTIEVIRFDIGAQVAAHEIPLSMITFHTNETAQENVEMALESVRRHRIHYVTQPARVRMITNEDGTCASLEISSVDGTETILRLSGIDRSGEGLMKFPANPYVDQFLFHRRASSPGAV